MSAPEPPGESRTNTPTMPIAAPAIEPRPMRSPPSARYPTTQSEVVEASTAVRFEGACVSVIETTPTPPMMIHVPAMAAPRISLQPGRGPSRPRAVSTVSTSRPASRKRTPHETSEGMVSRLTRIAR